MKKEIIINEDGLKDEEITSNVVINKYILISNGMIYLKKHHNTYFFLDDEDVNDKSNLIITRKFYIKDYPFIGENTLNTINYYLSDQEYGDGIPLEEVRSIVEESRYDNPRNQDTTSEILEILDIVLNNK